MRYHDFWPSDFDLGVWPFLKKTLTLAIPSLRQDLSTGTNILDIVTLTLTLAYFQKL